MSATIHVLNGPNLNLLGTREPEVYGRATLADVEALCRAAAPDRELVFRQTNDEAELVGWVQEARASAGIVINPAAFSYASYALLDALKLCDCPVIEVHISNIHARDEAWRAKSILTPVVTGSILGLGIAGYALAVRHIAQV